MKQAIIDLIADNTGVSTEQARIIANEILKLQKTIHVVLSRDRSDFIYISSSITKAQNARKEQEAKEELAGGRPSVYIKTTILN